MIDQNTKHRLESLAEMIRFSQVQEAKDLYERSALLMIKDYPMEVRPELYRKWEELRK